MTSEIGSLHHVGHVVRDMPRALETYRRLGFACTPPTYPTLAPQPGARPVPVGAANAHANFRRSFVELVTVASETSPVPAGAKLVELQVPPAALERLRATLGTTVGRLTASLERFEGLHILVFGTSNAAATAARFDGLGIAHSGVSTVQYEVETSDGPRTVPVSVVEIDGPGACPEGRLAAAEPLEYLALEGATGTGHPNGAIELVEAILCVPDQEVERYLERYAQYVGQSAQATGPLWRFELASSSLVIVPAGALGTVLPGEHAPGLPAFVGYAIGVADPAATRRWLERHDVAVRTLPNGELLVPAAGALGASVLFRPADERPS